MNEIEALPTVPKNRLPQPTAAAASPPDRSDAREAAPSYRAGWFLPTDPPPV